MLTSRDSKERQTQTRRKREKERKVLPFMRAERRFILTLKLDNGLKKKSGKIQLGLLQVCFYAQNYRTKER